MDFKKSEQRTARKNRFCLFLYKHIAVGRKSRNPDTLYVFKFCIFLHMKKYSGYYYLMKCVSDTKNSRNSLFLSCLSNLPVFSYFLPKITNFIRMKKKIFKILMKKKKKNCPHLLKIFCILSFSWNLKAFLLYLNFKVSYKNDCTLQHYC